MQFNISSFHKYLEDEVDTIKSEFFQKYIVNSKRVDDIELEEIKSFFSLIIENISTSDLKSAVVTCERLIDYNIDLSVPYVILSHELINLKRLIMQKLLEKDAKDELYNLYQLNIYFEDIIAKKYLAKYIKELKEKNSIRISSLSDIYEQNVVSYYKAHLEWLNSLAKTIFLNKIEDFPETNHNLCTFGKWLLNDGKSVIQNNSKYKNISNLHENLHYLAKQIKNYLPKKEKNNHILITLLEKCEMISLSLGTEMALIDNTLINYEAVKDPLTGALNRQRLKQIFNNQIEISLATSKSFVLAMCDFDHFKNINDTYGHLAGDKLLESFVKIASKTLRSSDIIIRYGGEEFILILPAVDYKKAKTILNKVREDFANFVLEFENNKISATLSMGMFEINPEQYDRNYLKNFDNFISILDKSLYEAKDSGRNKIC